jgi:hypothetical protein
LRTFSNFENAFLTPIQDIEAKMVEIQIFSIFASIQYPESGSGKHFQGSKMCAFDFPHKVTPREIISKKVKKFTSSGLANPW